MAKIFVGMSGGVDSSVSAALVKRAGHDVTGVFIKVWQPDWIECNWKEERLEAMRAAAHLEIPFETLDLSQAYKRGVIDYMIAEYAAGRTPNPDVMCNRDVKFGAFWRWAKERGADMIATGHYAQIGEWRTESGEMERALLKGADENKDQTYFLWTLTVDDLAHIAFPIGHLTKPDVRKIAAKLKLPNADKKDSQGLCFIGKVDVKEFLRHYIRPKPGNVLDAAGQAIGTHAGAELLTIGERHGFTITAKTPNDAPYYIIAKDAAANTITVSNRAVGPTHPAKASGRNEAQIERVNWIGAIPTIGSRISARSRYREPLQGARIIEISGATARIRFAEPQATLTPGQSLVMYDGARCVGGGIIK